MRRTLIASSVAALALVGLAGGAAYAAESDSSPGADTTTVPEGTVAASPESTPPVELDSATVAAVFEVMGLDKAAVDCLVEGASAAAPTDDQSAELVFIGCGVGPLAILDAIVALDAQSGAVVTEDTAVVEDTGTVSLEPPSSVVSSGNAMVDLLLEQAAARGIDLTAEQGQCLLDNISGLDPTDLTASLEVFETCGIDIADLIPGS